MPLNLIIYFFLCQIPISSGPIFGKYMYTLKVRRVYFFGIIVTAICALVFGTLDFIEDKATFLALSYTLR